jgi:hypothetical protein
MDHEMRDSCGYFKPALRYPGRTAVSAFPLRSISELIV